MKLSFFLDKNDLIKHEFDMDKKHLIYSDTCIQTLGNIAWNIGILTAINISTFDDLTVHTKFDIPIHTNIIFSDYNCLTNSISLYKDNIEQFFLPNIPSKFAKYTNYNDAVYLLKLHEYFHYLQCSNNSFINVYSINCLNEIAAFSFAQKISGISFE